MFAKIKANECTLFVKVTLKLDIKYEKCGFIHVAGKYNQILGKNFLPSYIVL